MTLPHGARRAFRHLLPGSHRDEVAEELRFHLETRYDELVAAGMDPAAARREARRRFGDADRIAGECRELAADRERAERRAGIRDELLQDLSWSIRQLRRQPLLGLVMALILALGIGAATTLFSVADTVVFRPLEFEEPDLLVRIWETTPQGDRFSVSLPNLRDWQRSTDAFSAVGGFELRNAAWTRDGEPRRVLLAAVSDDFFSVLRSRPAIGSLLPVEAFEAGGDVGWVVLSDELWRRELGADPAVVGRKMIFDGAPYLVAGVLGPEPHYPAPAEAWVPIADPSSREREDKDFAAIARLDPGVSVEAASAELAAVTAALGERFPAANGGWAAEVVSLRESMVGPEVDRALLVLLCAVGLLLAIACVNVSCLLVARGAGRANELAVRVSVGASRLRLMRQLLSESAFLGFLGGVAGVALAAVGVALVRRFGPEGVPRLAEISVDGRVVAFAVGAALLSSLLFGSLPALQLTAGALTRDLRAAGRGSSASGAGLRGALVIAQLGFATTLLLGAGFTAHSYLQLLQVDLGFAVDDVLALRVDLPESSFGDEARAGVAAEIEDQLAALPGVAGVGGVVSPPFGDFYTAVTVYAPDWIPGATDTYPVAQWRAVTPGTLDALDLRLLRGRWLTAADGPDSDAVVVTQRLAEQFWPGRAALGEELRFGGPEGSAMTVVGVIGDIRDTSLTEAPQPTVFLPYARIPWTHQTWLIERTVSGAGPGATVEVAHAARATLRSLLPGVPVPEALPLDRDLLAARVTPRFETILMIAFAAVAATLAVAGVYGLVAFSVTRRRREIGVRLALGARPGSVVAGIVLRGTGLLLAGLGVGVAGALVLTRVLASLFVGAPTAQVAPYAIVLGLLAAAALLATWIPARRAAAIDPRAALAAD